jgi:hypothetical protein
VKRALREPLLHFLLLGGLLFLLAGWRGTAGRGSTRIVVTAGQIQHLAAGFARVWQRPPMEAELKGMIDDHVKEEIATREAAALGLDRDDTVIRRRLRQKLEFLAEESAVSGPPTDAEIQAWVAAHPDAVGVEPELSFRQVYLRADARGAGARAEAETVLTRLRAAGDDTAALALADATMLPAEMVRAPLREVSRTFGEGFARALAAVEPGRWEGPLESPYGLHLVLVRERVTPSAPDFPALRPLVERELMAERRAKELQRLYERMLEKYTVRIEMPNSGTMQAATVSP